jgi:hypothetical protein
MNFSRDSKKEIMKLAQLSRFLTTRRVPASEAASALRVSDRVKIREKGTFKFSMPAPSAHADRRSRSESHVSRRP